MKKIKIALFSLLFAGAISLTLASGSSQEPKGIELAEIYRMNQAIAEENDGYQIVSCHDEVKKRDDGTTFICHIVTCAGDGTLECKCYCE